MDGVGAVAQDQPRRVSNGLVCGGHAIASQQLPGHEDEGGVHILSLLGGGFQGGQHVVVFCQSAGVLEQDLPLGFQVRLITCREKSKKRCCHFGSGKSTQTIILLRRNEKV